MDRKERARKRDKEDALNQAAPQNHAACQAFAQVDVPADRIADEDEFIDEP